MKHIHKIELTEQDLHVIIRKHFGIDVSHDLEVNLVDTQEQPVNGEWIDVPSGWEHEHCPTEYSDGTKIDIMFRDGLIKNCVIGDYHDCWVQDQNSWNIVKYRVSKG